MRLIAFAACILLSACEGRGISGRHAFHITRITCYEVPGERTAVVAPNSYAGTRSRAVKENVAVIETNEPGLVGIGVAPSKAPPEACRKLLGMNPLDLFDVADGRIEAIREGYRELAYQLRGLDLAVLDLVGKLLERPVAELFGPKARQDVTGYDSSLYMEDLLQGKDLEGYAFPAATPMERLARKAEWTVRDRGFQVVKIKIGRSGRMKGDHAGVLADIEAVKSVRRAVGPAVRIFVDGNNGYKGRLDWVMEFVRGTRDCGVFALEEMFPEEVEPYARLRKQLREEGFAIDIADGESLQDFAAEWEENFLKGGLVNIAQPDLCAFGILGARRWAEMAARHGARLVCHNFGTKMGVWGAIHVALSVPNSDLVESDDAEFPSMDAAGLAFRDGRWSLKGMPGLGVRIDPAALATFRRHWTVE